MNNPILGTFLHAVGGASASMCYLPSQKTRQWSWGTFWLVQSLFAWLLIPLLIGWTTVPDFFHVLADAPKESVRNAFLLGAIYGFGGMSFGFAIQKIGYSLTYTISIGLSAILGTLVPLIMHGTLQHYFSKPGSGLVLLGMVIAVIGVALSGLAGFRKEKDLGENKLGFNMPVGLTLAILGGLLSAVFNISLEAGQPIADLAAERGAGHFEGNAKLIVSTSGCFVVNLIWFVVVGIKQGTLGELLSISSSDTRKATKKGSSARLLGNYGWSALAGTLWTGQFFFYGLGHVQMGEFQFISWVLHMTMLIFFSYIVGVIMKEWKQVQRSTYRILGLALVLLFISSVIIAYGSTF